MSGPKTSRYTLTPEQRRILAEQRKIERRKAVALESIKRSAAKLRQIGNLHNDKKEVAEELYSRTGDDGGYSAKKVELYSLIETVAPIVEATDSNSVDSLEKTANDVSEKLHKAEQLSAEIESIVKDNDSKLQLDLASNIDKGFHTSFADIISKGDEDTSANPEMIEELLKAKALGILPESYTLEIDNVIKSLSEINDKNFLKNYIALTVSPLLKKCNKYCLEYEQIHEEFESLYTEYISLCGLYYLVAQEYICSADSVEQLKTEIERIKHLTDEDDEQAYISEAVDEVMEEMGYSVIGSREVVKKNGRHFRNELYTYSDGTAVNVTFSSDGKIAMELGEIDSSDRLPDEHETAALCEQMEAFCDDFKEIEKRLVKKGVILGDRISLLPPDASCAQIINTSDYNLDEKVESLKVKRKSRIKTTQKAKKAE